MKIYVTKHVLTIGIQEMDALEIMEDGWAKVWIKELYIEEYPPNEWRGTYEEAKQVAEELREKAIQNTKAKFQRLENLKF